MMRYAVASLALLCCVSSGTELGAQRPAHSIAPTPEHSVSVAALRAGVTSFAPLAEMAAVPDTSVTGAGSVRRRVAHSAIGAGAGLLTGAGAGALVGWEIDHHPGGDGGMFPASVGLGAIGAAVGLVTGAAVGAFVR